MIYQDKPSLDEVYNSVFKTEDNDELMHYGMPRRSGRYPWGSGKEPYQHSGDFLKRVDELKKSGMSESEIAATMGIVGENGKPSSTRLRTQLSLAKSEQRSLQVDTAKGLREKGYSLNEIAKEMGFKNDSSVRSLLNEQAADRMQIAKETADFLKQKVNEKGMIDVGTGVERELGISKEKLDQALYILELEGYNTFGGRVPQVTNPKQQTTLRVLCPPDTPYKVNANGKKTSNAIYDYEKIHSLSEYTSHDDGKTFTKFHYPSSMDSKRLQIRYKEDGGIDKDGLVEIRRGVDDLSLGNSHYAQVRILVDGKKYIKGMAVYSDDLPDGVDIIFNTNKSKSVAKMDVLKDIKSDPDNPFGSSIKANGQYYYTDKNGKKKLGLINKRADEGDWGDWADKLPSQFLSKQSTSLAKQQLGIAAKDKQAEFDEIRSLNNPTVKKKLLQDFSDGCDSAAVHLYAAALPRQKYHVIIPLPSLRDNEIYAPNYKDGEKVALIRYPHGGTFEIPVCTVNNKNPKAKKLIGSDAIDAVCINSKVAERLSGADFDGDTVMVIPTNSKVKINSSKQLADLKDFDPKVDYATTAKRTGKYDEKGKEIIDYYNAEGNKVKIMKNTQNEMGRISNLITDMTLKGAKEEELARAVKHSMVVIDAEKHKLDYRKSYTDNGIDSLKKKYQEGGASTLISRAKSETSVPKRQGSPKINIKGKDYYDPSRPEGALLYKDADDLYYVDRTRNKNTGIVSLRTVDGKKVSYDPSNREDASRYEPVKRVDPKTGEVTFTNKKGDISYRVLQRSEKSTRMADTDDARTLISNFNTPMERIYADYANKMKSLANEARKELATTGRLAYSKTASQVYKNEVNSLNAKLNESLKNKPRERQAQTIANSRINAMKQENPSMTKEELKKRSQQELSRARDLVGAKRTNITVTDKEWEAIQAGAIHENKLKQILDNADIDVLREKATPRATTTLSTAKINRLNAMRNSGLSIQQIANALGVSTSTVSKYLR